MLTLAGPGTKLTVAGPGTIRMGRVVSRTVMVWMAVAVLPHASVALQVRVMMKAWGQGPGLIWSEDVMVGVLQLSMAVAEPVPVALGSVEAVHST